MIRSITLTITLLLMVGIASAQTPGQSANFLGAKVVSIAVTQAWTATGVVCSLGDTLYITVQGVFSFTTNDPNAWCGPSGNGWGASSEYPVPSASSMSVVGKVGTSGTGFPVGEHRVYVPDVPGELYLGINDIANFSDNGGALVATIIKQKNHYITTKIVGEKSRSPLDFEILQNYPNPFNPSTTIEYQVLRSENVGIKIYDSAGKLVRTIENEAKEPGQHHVVWDGKTADGTTVASGSYYYQIKSGDFTQTKKMLLLK